MDKNQFNKIIEISENIGVLTGAGISTYAGIPDFRGPNGIYTTKSYDPEKTFDLYYFLNDPKPFYNFSYDFFKLIENAKISPAHKFLYELEKQNKLLNIITQNIDGLHQKAGNTKVLEFHGSYNNFYCTKCHALYDTKKAIDLIKKHEIPYCEKCHGLVKPDIVFFQESVKFLNESIDTAENSDLFLIIGTSLAISPANMIPLYAKKIIILNNIFPDFFNHPNYEFIQCDLNNFFREYE